MFEKVKNNRGQMIYTIVTVFLLCTIILSMLSYVFSSSEKEAYENLHLETQEIKNDIKLQMISDRENLVTMANFAAKLHNEGEDLDIMFQAFEKIGLIDNIGILLPDNRFITKVGAIDVKDKLSFEKEVEKGEYISGRVRDITVSDRYVVRSAVPIQSSGETVGIIYGVIELKTLEEKYIDDAEVHGATLYILEGGSGKYLVDTKSNSMGSITGLASVPFGKGYSYDEMVKNINEGVPGYSAFLSQTTGEYNYVHYAPIGVSDWYIMLSKPESSVFANAEKSGKFLGIMFAVIVFIMAIYLLLVINSAKKKADVSVIASAIRKNLLELNRSMERIHDALEKTRVFAKARSAFFVDTFGEDYSEIAPKLQSKLISGEDRTYFISKLMSYVSQHKLAPGVSVQIIRLVANDSLKKSLPDFYEFLVKHDITSVCFAGVVDDSGSISLVGTVNPKNHYIKALLKDIAVCFFMAIYNKKHLTKTETMALSDSLTGLANRMAYKQDIKSLENQAPENLACVYIDVNELHYFNNKYGHAAGDQMLVFIAEVLETEFKGEKIYRMGGDEFLIFTKNILPEDLDMRIRIANEQILEMKYHISVGVQFISPEITVEELVKEAEKEMFLNKAKYYQDKEYSKVSSVIDRKIEIFNTGIKEVDACLAIMSTHYFGAYCVSLDTDKAFQVLAPEYFFKLDNENSVFSEVMKNYIHDLVKPEYQRTLLQFLEYDVLKRQLKSGHNPKISYTKIDGEKIIMSIYAVANADDNVTDVVWIFEKQD